MVEQMTQEDGAQPEMNEHELRRRFLTVLRDSNDAITMQDLEGRLLAWNRGAERMYGYTEAEALRLSADVLVPEWERERARGFLEAIARGEAVHSLEVTRRTKDGRLLDVWLTTTKLVDDDGRTVGVATTERDITDRRRNELERERLIGKLTDALRARDDFLAIASHELKTPVAALKLAMETIARGFRGTTVDAGRLATAAESAARQAAQLSVLIDELLDVTRMASGSLKLQREEVDLAGLVLDVLDRLREMLAQAGCSTRPRLQTNVVGSYDRLRMEQVLTNLITNAVRHGQGSAIDVLLEADAERAILTVRDHGPGIAAVEHERIFERFSRAAPEGVPGLGLGLYICRQIAEAHGGEIHVESTPGAGASFVVTLPREIRQ